MALEMDSGEKHWFINSVNVAIQITISASNGIMFVKFAIFDFHDAWWQKLWEFLFHLILLHRTKLKTKKLFLMEILSNKNQTMMKSGKD